MKNIFVLLISILVVFNTQAQKFKADAGSVNLEFEKKSNAITWINPAPGVDSYPEKELVLEIGVKLDSEVKQTTIYRNGLPQSNSRGFTKQKAENEFSEMIEFKLFLNEGDNSIKIELVDANDVKYTDERMIRVEDESFAAIKNRRKFALIFATDQYDEWGDLVNPVNDAREIAGVLKDEYAFDVDLVENATKTQVLSKVLEYSKKSYLDHDQLFIFFAGHGQFSDLNGEGYLVCKDSRTDDPVYDSYISHPSLRTRINSIPCQHIFLTIDACFGGTFDQKIAQSGSRGGASEYEDISVYESIQRRLRYKTRKYLTSGGKKYVSDGIPGHNSPFAARMLEALRSDGGPDKILTLDDIKNFVILLPEEPFMGGFGQDESGSDFVFERMR